VSTSLDPGRKVRVGIIGSGGIARLHARYYKPLPFVEVTAVADIVPGRAQAFVEREGLEGAVAYESHEALLDKSDVEAVSICTYNMAHRQPTVDALTAGKHVLLEKPMAATLPDAQAIMRAWEAADDRILMVAFQPDFGPQHKAAKAVMDSGALGEIYYAESVNHRRWGIPGGSFLRKDSAGLGALVDIGVYALHSTLTLMGDPKPVSVSAITTSVLGRNVKGGVGRFGRWSTWRSEEIEVEEFAAAFVRLESGGVILFKTCWASNADSIGRPFFLGTKGGMALNPRGVNPPIELFFNQQIGELNMTGAPQGMEQYEDWPLKIQAFAEAVRDGKPSPIDPRGVYLTNVIMDGAQRSAELGYEVKVDCSY
jgi:predicted dehydrogenase